MDKQSIIVQLELDINALQRQVDEFKRHPEEITPVEWELFVQRLNLMHEYCRHLKLEAQADKKQDVKQDPVIIPVPHESELPKTKMPEIIAKEASEDRKVATPVPVQQIEIIESPVLQVQKEEIIAQIATPVTEAKSHTPKSKKQAASIGSLFGDTLSVASKYKDEPSVADSIAKSKSEKSVADKMQHKPVKDLKDAIGINEKFLFINELFDGNLQDYSEAISKINESGNLQAAQKIISVELAVRYNWADNSEHVKNFKDLVERRFIS